MDVTVGGVAVRHISTPGVAIIIFILTGLKGSPPVPKLQHNARKAIDTA